MKDVIAITSFCDTKEKLDVLVENINIIRRKYSEFDIAIHANYPLPEYIQKMVDHYFYEDLNVILDNFILLWNNNYYFNKRFNRIIRDYGFCVLLQIKNLAKYLIDYDRIMLINYDIILTDSYFYDYKFYYESDFLCYTFYPKDDAIFLMLMSFNPSVFMNNIANFINSEKYLSISNTVAEEKMIKFLQESKLNFKLLVGDKLKDKINNNFNFEKNLFFENSFVYYNQNILEIYFWNFYSSVVKEIILEIDYNTYLLTNKNNGGAFECNLTYDKKINNISIIKMDNLDVNIPLKLLDSNDASIEKI